MAERYFLYSSNPKGDVFRGQVHHTPYEVFHAKVARLDESLVAAAGFAHGAERAAPDLFSPGVDVEVFSLEKV